MTSIKKERILSLTLSFDTDFAGGDVLAQSSVSLKPIVAPSDKDAVHLFVDFSFTCQAMTNDFKIDAKLIMPFYLSPKSGIVKPDFYKCVELAKDHLQNIINATFAGQNPISVSPIDFDDLEDKLDEHIQSLH